MKITLTGESGLPISAVEAEPLKDFPQFAVHTFAPPYTGWWRVSHIETGAQVGGTAESKVDAIEYALIILRARTPKQIDAAIAKSRKTIAKLAAAAKRKAKK